MSQLTKHYITVGLDWIPWTHTLHNDFIPSVAHIIPLCLWFHPVCCIKWYGIKNGQRYN